MVVTIYMYEIIREIENKSSNLGLQEHEVALEKLGE